MQFINIINDIHQFIIITRNGTVCLWRVGDSNNKDACTLTLVHSWKVRMLHYSGLVCWVAFDVKFAYLLFSVTKLQFWDEFVTKDVKFGLLSGGL